MASLLKKQGFILTRQWRDTPAGIELEIWLASQPSPIQLLIASQQAVCFIREQDSQRANELLADQVHCFIKPLPLKNFHGEPVAALYCRRQGQLRECCKRLDDKSIRYWENDIKPVDRFLMERFITASVEIDQATSATGDGRQANFRCYRTERVKPASYTANFSVVSLDIETSMDGEELYSIAVFSHRLQHVFMVGDQADQSGSQQEEITLSWHPSARDCLQDFITWLTDYDPDIIIGWHVVQFDLWVLQQLCKRWKLPFRIGRASQLPRWRENRGKDSGKNNRKDKNSSERHYLYIPGRIVLDGIELLRTTFYFFESYSLQFVANELLGEGKLVTTDQRAEAITHLFAKDKLALARYNLKDCQLVWDIFEKTKLLDFAVERARLTGLPLDRVGGSVASFEYAYLPRLHRHGYVAPNLNELKSEVVSPGGYVMRSLPGIYRHVLVLDFKSLYPSIIRSFHIDPYAFWYAQHNQLNKEAIVEGFNGAYFAREQAILPDIIEGLWRARESAKKDHNQPLSHAIKIIMNAFYGVLGSRGCRFFDPRICSSITLRGHEIIQHSRDWIEDHGYRVIYGDTDSVFIWLGNDCGDKSAMAIGESLAAELNSWWTERLNKQFNIESALEIEFETHYSHFLMPTIRGAEHGSKKRYAGVVIGNDDQPKLVFKGLETVRTDWTALAKQFQQALYQRVFYRQPYADFIKQTVAELLSGNKDNDLVYRKRLRQPLSAYCKTNPPHVKAARKLTDADKLGRGSWITYRITVNGPEPTANQTSQIDYQHYIDKQLQPVADSILQFVDDSFESITQRQMVLL